MSNLISQKLANIRIKHEHLGGSQSTSLSLIPTSTSFLKTDPADHKNQKKNKCLGVHFILGKAAWNLSYYDPSTQREHQDTTKYIQSNNQFHHWTATTEAKCQGNSQQSARRLSQTWNPISIPDIRVLPHSSKMPTSTTNAPKGLQHKQKDQEL